ncbi:MAG: cation:proton antiporter, partial [Pirellulaceae bacterium]|nr:cation:proton antiporter [Pirellulaceae bacterium]
MSATPQAAVRNSISRYQLEMHDLFATILGVVGLLAISSVLLPVATRINFPFTVLLALVGVVLGGLVVAFGHTDIWLIGDFMRAVSSLEITSDAVFFLFLPTLVFEAALSINVRQLLDDLLPILVLAIVGLLISTSMVGYALWWASGVSLVACLLLGTIVSATDPVAVIALFKDMGAPHRLATLVEGESLFNDATAIVLFSILAAMLVSGQDPAFGAGTLDFLRVFIGGVVVGYVLAWLTCNLIGLLQDVPLVEVTLTVCLAYLTFIVAEHYLHVSGVMAVVTAGLVLGSYGRTKISPESWDHLHVIWEQLAFWANSLIFFLVGLLVPSLLLDVTGREFGWLCVL